MSLDDPDGLLNNPFRIIGFRTHRVFFRGQAKEEHPRNAQLRHLGHLFGQAVQG
jgi:hypothetical protein